MFSAAAGSPCLSFPICGWSEAGRLNSRTLRDDSMRIPSLRFPVLPILGVGGSISVGVVHSPLVSSPQVTGFQLVPALCHELKA